MNKILTISGLVVVLSLGLSGCAPGNNTVGSTAVGAGLGGLLGATLASSPQGQVIGLVGGALVGGLVGNQIGQSMDRRDAAEARRIYESDSGSGSWTSEEGASYTIEPVKTYTYEEYSCRKYKTVMYGHGEKQVYYGRACRIDGRWRVMERA